MILVVNLIVSRWRPSHHSDDDNGADDDHDDHDDNDDDGDDFDDDYDDFGDAMVILVVNLIMSRWRPSH